MTDLQRTREWDSEDPELCWAELADEWGRDASILAHLTSDDPVPSDGGPYDLVCLRCERGLPETETLAEIAQCLAQDGGVVGIAAGESHRIETQEIFGRGAGWPPAQPARFALPVRLAAAGLELVSFAEYYGVSYCPDIEFLAADLQHSGLIPSFDRVGDALFLREVGRKLTTERGIRDTEHFVVFVARKARAEQ